jgi:hypothetical protein
LSYDNLGTSYATYADLPSISYDSTVWTSGSSLPAVFDTSHNLKTLDGTATTSGFVLADIGNGEKFSRVMRVRPLFFTAPDSATLTNYYRNNLGDSLTTGATTNLANGKFDLKRSARWHRLELSFSGDVELGVLEIPMTVDGDA